MTPQAQTSERDVKEALPHELIAFLRERIRADAEKIRALEEERREQQYLAITRGDALASAKTVLAAVRDSIEEQLTFGYDEKVDRCGWMRGEISRIDAALATTQSPRSEAGEDVK